MATKRTVRRSRYAGLKRNGLGQVKDAVSIRQKGHLLLKTVPYLAIAAGRACKACPRGGKATS